MPQVDSSERSESDILEIRSRICNGLLLTMMVWSVPALAASLYRFTSIGWYPVMGVHIVLVGAIWAGALLRSHLSLRVRSSIVLVTFIAVGLGGLFQFGLVAAGIPFMVVAGAISAMLYGQRGGLVAMTAALAGSALIALGYVTGAIRLHFDLGAYVISPVSWITAIFAWGLVGASLMVSTYIYNRHLRDALDRSRAREDDLRMHRQQLEDVVKQRTRELKDSHDELQTAHRVVTEQAKNLRELSVRDELTGLYNRRYFNDEVDRLIRHAVRYRRPLAIALADLDNFKSINDRYGHATGDLVLRAVARSLLGGVRAVDVVARYGGEEFVIVFPEAEGSIASAICERLRESLESYNWRNVVEELQVTVSVGVCVEGADEGVDAMLHAADRCLYRAKSSGRNRVVCSTAMGD